ncbi:MAG: T9SS type A sorting domain-containing protein, partial [Saprospiraceae bacterium]|nr:T9SS type A sorting domain-containing protein [Saprospiraceae bacterium]
YQDVSDSFDLEVNGHFQGTYAYSDLPITVGRFEGGCDTRHRILICDQEKPDCCVDGVIEAACCEECDLFELAVEVIECDSNRNFSLDIDFLYENVSDSFDLEVNGHFQGTYAYSDLPITVGRFEGGCDRRHEILICDQEDPHCCIDRVIEAACCDEECEIGELEVEAVECNGDSCLVIELDFEHSGTGDQFDVFDRNGIVGTYFYAHLPLVIECYPISGHEYEYIRVCDRNKERCCAEAEFETLDCEGTFTLDLNSQGWEVNYATASSTLIFNDIGANSPLEFMIHDINGIHIHSDIIQTTQTTRIHAQSGVYIVQLKVGEQRYYKKILVMQ